jgi:4-alpha-glucanotransferase
MHQDHFCLDPLGKRTVLAGVPPDYFSQTGQLWSNPLYRWDAFAATGYEWWVKRLRHAFSLFDIVRIDHFRGFQSYWEVPAAAETAIDGHWAPGPGRAPFRAAERELGQLRIVAEDLGMITPEVHALRDELGFPGMRVLQFGFDEPGGEYHRPEGFPDHCVVYTGTHDNDTAVGWYRSLASSKSGSAVDDYLSRRFGSERREIHWDMIRLAFSSVADTAIVPLQDVLGLGSEARMNTPGQPEGNWKWRYRAGMLTTEVEQRLRDLAQCCDRGR